MVKKRRNQMKCYVKILTIQNSVYSTNKMYRVPILCWVFRTHSVCSLQLVRFNRSVCQIQYSVNCLILVWCICIRLNGTFLTCIQQKCKIPTLILVSRWVFFGGRYIMKATYHTKKALTVNNDSIRKLPINYFMVNYFVLFLSMLNSLSRLVNFLVFLFSPLVSPKFLLLLLFFHLKSRHVYSFCLFLSLFFHIKIDLQRKQKNREVEMRVKMSVPCVGSLELILLYVSCFITHLK